MKLLSRNLVKFTYMPYEGVREGIDEDERYTGVQEPYYGDPVTYKGNISIPSGQAVQAFDGLEIRYSHVLIMGDPNADINEYGKIIWNKKQYSITAVRRSLNFLSAALMEDAVEPDDFY